MFIISDTIIARKPCTDIDKGCVYIGYDIFYLADIDIRQDGLSVK